MERKKKCCMLLVSILAFSVLSIHSVGAVDELYLVGVIMGIDLKAGTVLVDVKSHNCKGLHRFRVDDASALGGLEGRKISFGLDSSVCRSEVLQKLSVISVLREERTQ